MEVRACWNTIGERTELPEKGQLWAEHRVTMGGWPRVEGRVVGESENLGARWLSSLKTAKGIQRNSWGEWAQGSNLQKTGPGLWEGGERMVWKQQGKAGGPHRTCRVAGNLRLRGEGEDISQRLTLSPWARKGP